jgi:DHA2 family multidrug resistance protein-like MFS transporter
VPPLVSVGLAVVAGLCSIARLRPSIRNPTRTEVQGDVPTLKTTR